MMIVTHATGSPAALRDILRTYSRIVADGSELIGTLDAQGKGYRTRWADTAAPTDAELRSIGYSYTVDMDRPTPDEGDQVRPGPLTLIEDTWRQTWIVEAIPPPGVPEEVDALALELVLIDAGYGDAVNAYLATQSPATQARWRRRATMRRDSEDIEAGRVALGLTNGQVDGLFIAAKAREGEV